MTPSHRVTPTRLAGAGVLLEVEQGAHAEDVLAALPAETRQGAMAISLGVLRCRARVDAVLRTALSRPLGSVDPVVRTALRIGAWERWLDDRDAHAAVDQAVELARALGAERATSFVNGVLRRARPPSTLTDADAADLPDWLWERWEARWGAETAWQRGRTAASPPPLYVVGRHGALPEGASPTPVAGVGIGPAGGRIPDRAGFAEGSFWVADLAAVAVADQVGGARVLDATAAPGGKAFRLADRGAEVVAVDLPGRLGRLQASVERLGLAMQVMAHDWLTGPIEGLGAFDTVLVDAPCSGLGTIRRHPEIKWRRLPHELPALAARQDAIVAAAAHHVRPGGELVVAVCSLEDEETQPSAPPGFERVERWHTPDAWEADGHHLTRFVRRPR